MKRIIRIISLVILLIIICYGIIFLIVNHNKKKFQIPVLMYHNVVYDTLYNGQPDTITLSMLEEQLKYLKENDYTTLKLDEFYKWKKGEITISKKTVVLTFDDGFYSFHYLVEPLLEKYNMNAINFIIGIATPNITNEYDINKYGTIGIDLIENHSKTVEYGSHSFDLHKMINGKKKIETVNEKEIQNDINAMKKIYKFEYISYPFNTDTNKFIKILKKNKYKLAFRGESEKATINANNYQIPRIGIKNDINHFKSIFETDYYNNRYGTNIIRKIFITLERKIGKRLF